MASMVTVSLLLLALALTLVFGRYQRTDLESDITAFCSSIAATMKAVIPLQQQQAAIGFLSGAQEHPAVRRGWLLDEQRQVFASHHRPGLEPSVPPAQLEPGVIRHGAWSYIVAAVPRLDDEVRSEPEAPHALTVLEIDPGVIDQRLIRDLLPWVISLLLVMFLIALWVAGRLAGRVSRPVTELSQTMGRIAIDHDFGQRAAGAQIGEIQVLVNSFNDLLEDLQERDAALLAAQGDSEQRAREAEAARGDLAITLDSIDEAVVAMDARSRVLRMNPVGERMTGWAEAEALGKQLGDVLKLQSTDGTVVAWDQADLLADPDRINRRTDLQLMARDGTLRAVSASLSAILDPRGLQHGAVLVCRDTSDQVELQEQLRQSQKMQAVGQLAGGVAHDFNNLLTGILGCADLLQLKIDGSDEIDRAELEQFVAAILHAGGRAADLTTQLLAFSRRQQIRHEAVDMHRAVHNVLDFLRRTIDPKVSIYTALEAGSAHVMGDATQLESALLNLAINARDAMPDGGALSFASRVAELDAEACAALPFAPRPGSYLEMRVSDTGCGMSAKVAGRVFEPFFTTKEVGEGTGLGLAAVYGTVETHAGSIRLETAPGEGTSFFLYLPLAEQVVEHADPAATDSQRGAGTVLYVDDDEACRGVAQTMLEELGYRALIADGGREALRICKREPGEVALVVLDMQMPGMSGWETAAELRKRYPGIPLLFCSGEVPDSARTEEFSEVELLPKPYRLQAFADAVARALGQRSPTAREPGAQD